MPDKNHPRDGLVAEPFWYKSGVIYEVHVRAFQDSDGNGIGDFRGLTSRLDYLKDLGVTAVWLLPFYPSPLRDDGYDIADYYDVHPAYGTLADFKTFLAEAHWRGLRVITELVVNHTSDQHPWFQRARRAPPGSRWRNFYVWSDTADRYRDARIIFKDVEVSNWSWDHVAGAYFWHRFFSHQPDLNYDNPEVFAEILKVLDFWLELGVDGLRLDAVPYLYEREGTSCENLPETHEALKRLRAHVDAKYGDRMLLAEANQWPEDAVKYFGLGRGDECHMAFHFPLMPRLFMAVRMEDRTPIVDILEQTPAVPETAQWALFLRNHDELTLEMVTDEERDYMYRMYAHVHQARLNLGIRRRLAPLLGNDRKRIELLNALLFSLPGTPVLYYGDEIGMGDNIFLGDRNGVRTPMQWSSDKNAGFSRANPQALYLPIIYDPEYHYEAVNVEAQLQNPHSLLWWTRRLLALRKRWRALGEGRCEFLQPDNRRILAYLLRHEAETLLVVANLSRFVQPVELDLSAFKGRVPMELFGRTGFPAVTEAPYFLTLSPHAFFWFTLQAPAAAEPAHAPARTPAIAVTGGWTAVLAGPARARLEAVLPDWLRQQRWFGGPHRQLKQVTLLDPVPVSRGEDQACLALAQVEYSEGEAEVYALPLAFAPGARADEPPTGRTEAVLCELATPEPGRLYDATGSETFAGALFELIARRRRIKSAAGELAGARAPALRSLLAAGRGLLPTACRADPGVSVVTLGDKAALKVFRRLHAGVHPDVEMARFLATHGFEAAEPLAGHVEFRHADGQVQTLAVLRGHTPGAPDGWQYTLDALGRYYDRIISLTTQQKDLQPDLRPFRQWLELEEPVEVKTLVGTYLEAADRLGRHTAALHLALASDPDDPAFAPEPFTPHYLQGVFQSMRHLATHHLRLLRRQLRLLPAAAAALAPPVLDREAGLIAQFRALYERRPAASRIRCHGDLHLGRWVHTGRDFVILDFEGRPQLPASARRIKRAALRDVACLVSAFRHAAWAGLEQQVHRGSLEAESLPRFEPWAAQWQQTVSVGFLRAYLDTMGNSVVVPRRPEECLVLLAAYLLEKFVEELGDALRQPAPDTRLALRGIAQLLDGLK
jgi:maltose alpha-D-glucosyltransferase/alpha-amylase